MSAERLAALIRDALIGYQDIAFACAIVGAVLLMAGSTGRVTSEIAVMGIAGATALAVVDLVYVTKRVIPRIYLLDAAAEGVIIAGWLVAWLLG